MDNRANESSSNSSLITPASVHQAFVNLTNYYHTKGFGSLGDNSDLKVIEEEIINVFFPQAVREDIDFLIPHATSTNNLNKISYTNNSKNESEALKSIAAIGNHINTIVLPTDSCGKSANDTSLIFLGTEDDKLIPNKKNISSFSQFEGEDNTIMGEVMSFDSPVLIRIEIKRLQKEEEITTHSYCVFVAEEKNELGISVYQAYFGQYTLAEWFNDPKFKIQPINFESYINQLEKLTSQDESIRKKAYGELYRLTGSESDVPNKTQLYIYYKMLPVDLSLAMNNINTKMEIAQKIENEITEKNNGQPITPVEHMKNACWRSLTDYPSEKILNIRNVVEAYQAEIQMTLDRFTNTSQNPSFTASSSSATSPSPANTGSGTNTPTNTNQPDEWKRFEERHPNLSSYNATARPSPSEATSLPTIEDEHAETNEKNDILPTRPRH
ncbi:MAG: hypothetical protein V4501_12825 [Pseudomonadota bacterium]